LKSQINLKYIKMKNRIIRAIAGSFVLLSVVLSIYVDQNWLWFTAFVGAVSYTHLTLPTIYSV